MRNENGIYQLIKNSALFDPNFYLAEYKDILPKNYDPIEHFIKIGWKNELNPSPNFDMHAYLAMNPDVKNARMNPLVHYLQFGKNEKRAIFKVDQNLLNSGEKIQEKGRIQNSIVQMGEDEGLKVDNLLPLIESLKNSEFSTAQIESLIDDYYEIYFKFNKFKQKPLIRIASYIDRRLPENGRIQKFLRESVRLYSLLKNQGIKGFIKEAREKKQKNKIYKSSSNLITESPIQLNIPTILSQTVLNLCIRYYSDHPALLPDIFIFPSNDFRICFGRTQRLGKQFSENGHRVFYVQPSFIRGPDPEITQISKNTYSARLPQEAENGISINFTLSKNDTSFFESALVKVKTAFNIYSAIMLVDFPFWRKLVFRLRDVFGWKLIYDRMDEQIGVNNCSAFTITDDQMLLTKSNLIFASSKPLFERYRRENKNTVLIPNGSDLDFIHESRENVIPEELATISHPIVGYWGENFDWLDVDLLNNLADEHNEWNFVLVSQTHSANIPILSNKPNIHFVDSLPYNLLPAYLNNFDVCIIPYTKNKYTEAINPVNMYVYLSAGKPIVATQLKEISRFSEYLRLAETYDEWNIAIQESLSESHSAGILNKRLNFAELNTWGNRPEMIESEFKKLFPKISIIIVTYNNLNLTKMCLDSIQNNTEYPNYEVIVVDNASSDTTTEYLDQYKESHENIRIVKNDRNLGFATANNVGFKIATGDYIVFLNNDTIVTPGWLYNLSLHLIKNPGVGMVGPVTNAIGNEAKIDIDYNNLDEINFFAARRSAKYSGISFTIRVLALYCSIISRDFFASLGGLDEQFHVGMFEDDDLAMKINQAGLQLLCAEDVFIHHFHGASFNKIENQEVQRIFIENKLKFETKWGIKWQPHQNR